ncbi:MAG: MATE family efflux transporter, partial [Oscillospiraceae bacterium]|nr:MATE family efflux transporter [Oscillospiraceae bacterium]
MDKKVHQLAEAVKNDFSKGGVGHAIFQMAVPTTIAQLVNLLYSVVDRVFIGHLPASSSLALTGLGLCLPVISIVIAFARLCGAGGGPLCGIFRGQGNLKRAQRAQGNSFAMLVVLGLALTAVGEVFLQPILFAFGASADTFGYAAAYARIYLIGNVFVMISLGMNSLITAQGFGRTAMVTTMMGAAINLALDPIFIFGLDMGVEGAALATVIAQMCS